MNFDTAFEMLLGHEGGYVSAEKALRTNDPGGETKFGISKRSYPHLDIKALTLDDCKAIYKRDFWGPACCDALPDCIRFDMFDMAVNSGVSKAAKTLQRAAFAEPDGVIGPRTLMGVQVMSKDGLIRRFNGARLEFMASLPNWPSFGRGWARRIAANLMESNA
jgi:lysozyme family protein